MKLFARIFTVLLMLVSIQATSQDSNSIYIKVGDAKVKKSLMALPPFQFHGTPAQIPNFRSIGQELFNVFYNDLDVSAYFQFINQNAFLEDTQKVGLKPAPGEPGGFNFDNWKKIGAEFLVRAAYKIEGKTLFLEAYVYHVTLAKVVLAKTYKGTTNDARLISHTFANELVEALTGKKGYFTSKIVTSTDRGGGKSKEIYVLDWDAANPQRITFTRNISISPNWSPDGSTIVYTTYTYHKNAKLVNTDLLSYDLRSKKRFLLSWQRGINSGGAFSPDGKYVYLTNSNNDNHDIFRINASDGKNRVQITQSRLGQLNVEPSISPDGTKIAYSSDRDGKPMIYVMNTDGSNNRRITFAGNYNSSPQWSPDGKKIVFSGQDGKHFDIFIMNADGTGLERLTSATKKDGKPATNEFPSFSPDGRQVMFVSNRTGTNQIFVISVDGSNERRITFDQYNYYSPKWLWKN